MGLKAMAQAYTLRIPNRMDLNPKHTKTNSKDQKSMKLKKRFFFYAIKQKNWIFAKINKID